MVSWIGRNMGGHWFHFNYEVLDRNKEDMKLFRTFIACAMLYLYVSYWQQYILFTLWAIMIEDSVPFNVRKREALMKLNLLLCKWNKWNDRWWNWQVNIRVINSFDAAFRLCKGMFEFNLFHWSSCLQHWMETVVPAIRIYNDIGGYSILY